VTGDELTPAERRRRVRRIAVLERVAVAAREFRAMASWPGDREAREELDAALEALDEMEKHRGKGRVTDRRLDQRVRREEDN
jgi:hypothetical protein